MDTKNIPEVKPEATVPEEAEEAVKKAIQEAPSRTPPTLDFSEKIREDVRASVTKGLLAIFGFVVAWSCVESASWPEHWKQTQQMLQVILPALTGLIGSALGFYFGAGGAIKNNPTGTQSTGGKQ